MAAAALVLLGACASSVVDAPVRRTVAPSRTADVVPDACDLIPTRQLTSVLGDAPAGDGRELENEGTVYGRTCLWGEPTGESGAIGVQVGVADEDGHDMVFNRSVALEPSLVISAVPGGIGAMHVAVLPVGGMKGATVFFQVRDMSVMVAVTGPNGSLETAQGLAVTVRENLLS